MKVRLVFALILLAASTAALRMRQIGPEVPIDGNTLGVAANTIRVTADGRRIYYTRHNEAEDLWLYDRDSKTSRLVQETVEGEFQVSPTKDAIVFRRPGERDAELYFWILPLDPRTGLRAGPSRRLTILPGWGATFSPDGRSIAFVKSPLGGDDSTSDRTILVVPTTGGPERMVAQASGFTIGSIHWNRDGKGLIVVGDDDAIRKIPLVGGTFTKVSETWDIRPGLSPDGRTFAFGDTVDGPGGSRQWVVTDTVGRRLGTFTIARGRGMAGNAWLDATHVLVRNLVARRSQIHLYTFATGKDVALPNLPDTTNAGAPALSPDGTLIAARRGDTILVFNRVGGAIRGSFRLPGSAGRPTWSPDQRWITATNSARALGDTAAIMAVELATGRRIAIDPRVKTDSLPGLLTQSRAFVWHPDSRRLTTFDIIGSSVGAGGQVGGSRGGRGRSGRGAASGRRLQFRSVGLNGTASVAREIVSGSADALNAIIIDSARAVVHIDGEVRIVSIDGRVPDRVVLRRTDGTVSSMYLSPDRRWIALWRNPDGYDASGLRRAEQRWNTLELFPVDGSARSRTMTVSTPLSNSGPGPLPLPGGNEVLVTEELPLARGQTVYLVNLSTKSVKKLFTRQGEIMGSLSLTSDGKELLYDATSWRPTSLFSLDIGPIVNRAR